MISSKQDCLPQIVLYLYIQPLFLFLLQWKPKESLLIPIISLYNKQRFVNISMLQAKLKQFCGTTRNNNKVLETKAVFNEDITHSSCSRAFLNSGIINHIVPRQLIRLFVNVNIILSATSTKREYDKLLPDLLNSRRRVTKSWSDNNCTWKLTRPDRHIYCWLAGDLKLTLKVAMEAN